MNLLRSLILSAIIISLCLGNEVFTNYSLNQNLVLESMPIKPAPLKVTFGIIAAEFGGGLIGGVCGTTLGALAVWGLEGGFGGFNYEGGDELGESMFLMLTFGYIFGTLGSAVGTCIVGNAFHQNGRFPPTLTGSALGLLVFSPVGSVIGYNMSRPKPVKQAFLYQYFDLPAFGFRTEKTKENKIIPVLDFRLVNAKF